MALRVFYFILDFCFIINNIVVINIMWFKEFKNKKYELDELDLKHNLWRMKNDLLWLCKNTNNISNLASIYWFDIDLKNICFPWVLKLEREFKSVFIWYYKQNFHTNDSQYLLDKKYYNVKKNNTKKIDKIIYNVEDILAKKRSNNIDELVFALTFGEFVTTFTHYNESIFNKVSFSFNLSPDIFCNILKFLNILRNSIAHNKTILKIVDEKNNKRFSLKTSFFDFQITKEHVDILSINAGGIIYVISKMIRTPNMNKTKAFLKEVENLLKRLKYSLDSKNTYLDFVNKIFLNYKDQILNNKKF